jgi:hypothetical protein
VLADAAETIFRATLAATTLLGLVLFAAFGWRQAVAGHALRAAASRAATGSQPSCFHTILPEAEVSTNHGWS